MNTPCEDVAGFDTIPTQCNNDATKRVTVKGSRYFDCVDMATCDRCARIRAALIRKYYPEATCIVAPLAAARTVDA